MYLRHFYLPQILNRYLTQGNFRMHIFYYFVSYVFVYVRLPVLYQSTVGLKQNTKDLLQKLNIPERPKKPLSPYFKFMVDNRDALQKSNPGITMSQISKKVAEAWKSLDSSKKLSYQQQYRQELEDYTKKFLQYESTLNEQQREALQIAKVEKTEDRKKRKIKKVML